MQRKEGENQTTGRFSLNKPKRSVKQMSGTGLQLDPQMKGWISKTDFYESKLGLNGNFLFLQDKFLASENKNKTLKIL